jgi:uncharacterized protein (DUF58 family)
MVAPGAPWDATVVTRLRRLHLRARQVAAGLVGGSRRSVRIGQAVEFAVYQPYSPGDSLRDLDWRVLARRDRLVVRRYRAETELGATLVLDASGDLGSTPEKWDTAVALVATLAYLCFQEGEPVGLVVVAGETSGLRRLVPRRGRAHLARLFGALAQVRPGGRASLAGAFAEIGARARARSLVVVVSDFMEPPEEWSRAVDGLLRRRTDVRALQLYDRREFRLDYDAPVRLQFAESGELEPVDPEAMRDAVRREGESFVAEVRRAFLQRRATHGLVEAREDLARPVADLLRGVA